MQTTIARKEKGQSLVELASVFVLLLILFIGLIDLGSILYSFTALRDISQEGAIYAAAHPFETTQIADRVKKSASFPVDSTLITNVNVTCGSGSDPCVTSNVNSCPGEPITVQINYSYHFLIFDRQTLPLTASVTETILALKANGQTCP